MKKQNREKVETEIRQVINFDAFLRNLHLEFEQKQGELMS